MEKFLISSIAVCWTEQFTHRTAQRCTGMFQVLQNVSILLAFHQSQ